MTLEYLWQIFNPGNTNFKNSLSGNNGTNYAIVGSTSGLQNYLELNPPVISLGLSSAYNQKGNAWQLSGDD